MSGFAENDLTVAMVREIREQLKAQADAIRQEEYQTLLDFYEGGRAPLSEEYVKRHNAFSQAVLDIDSSIKLVASGEAVRPNSDWDRQLLSRSADYIDLNSKHFYKQDWHGGGLMTHVRQIWLLRGALGWREGQSWPHQHWC